MHRSGFIILLFATGPILSTFNYKTTVNYYYNAFIFSYLWDYTPRYVN